jgi:AAA+ ATPase superfamily predicted ATPase
MRLPFLNRLEEVERLRRTLSRTDARLAVLYGRRRCGKSRLIREVLPPSDSVYYVADDRDGALQRAALAREVGRKLDGFDRVTYPDWDAIFSRWWTTAKPAMTLAIDEFPSLVAWAKEIPSVLQKYLDQESKESPHLLLAGSAQRMMQGMVLDRSAPLFGRAAEIIKISPLRCFWIKKALGLASDTDAVEAYSVWGGVPRYWELAADFESTETAIRELILSPLGVLHDEPATLLLEDLKDIGLTASVLALIGQGCHRLTEIAARLGKPATSLSRPLQRLIELDILRRDLPHGHSARDVKRTLYKIADPFLRFWFRYVEASRSRLQAGQVSQISRHVASTFPAHVGSIWEDLVRESISANLYFGREWKPAGRWWGAGLNRRKMEIDIVAESNDGQDLLVGEAKWSSENDPDRLRAELLEKARNLPFAQGRNLSAALWLKDRPRRTADHGGIFTPADVLPALK